MASNDRDVATWQCSVPGVPEKIDDDGTLTFSVINDCDVIPKKGI